MSLENYGKPDFFRYSNTYKFNETEISWYLDTSPKNHKITELGFETSKNWINEEEQKVANEICNWAKGKDLNQLPLTSDVSSRSLYPQSLLSYKLFINNINGKVMPFHKQKGENADELICRCFGVYKQEINDFLLSSSHENQTLQTLGQELRSGIGCGSCHSDLNKLLDLFGHGEEGSGATGVVLKDWRGLDTKQLANLCTAELLNFLEESGANHTLTVVGVQPDKVLIKYNGESDKVKVSDDVKLHFKTHLTPGLIISVIS
jgi:hypothetical protein